MTDLSVIKVGARSQSSYLRTYVLGILDRLPTIGKEIISEL